MGDNIVYLTIDEALNMLPEREVVHTFRQAGFTIIGCDWNRDDVINVMKKHIDTVQLSGKTATSMGHGIVMEDDRGYLFIETKEE